MYKNIFYDRGEKIVHLWDDEAGHKKIKPWKYGYGFIVCDEDTGWKNLHGQNVKRVDKKWDYEPSELYESDVKTEYRILLDEYLNKISYPKNLNILFFDIETEKTEDGYSTTENPIGKITAITMKNQRSKDGYVIVLDESKTLKNPPIGILNYELIVCDNEEDLLLYFFKLYESISPDILTGWNIDYYDIPYIYNRTKRVLNDDFANKLSPIGIVQQNYKDDRLSFKIAGVSSLDYIRLYRTFTQNEEPSYKLNDIAKKVLNEGKIQYDGSLYDLYLYDIYKFIEYNVNDVELVLKLDDKLKFINLAINTCSDGYVDFESVFMPSTYIDGAGLAYLRNKNIVADNGKNNARQSFAGAVVLDTKKGLFKWIYDLDLTSLYPSIIRTLNISPETLIGKISNWSPLDFINKNTFKKYTITFSYTNEVKEYMQDDLFEYVNSNNYSIAANGAFYRNDIRGFIPSILDTWFSLRVEYKDKMKKYKELGDTEKSQFYDIQQWTQKIKLNTFYGVLALPSYRFNDVINAEAITLTGQFTIISSKDVTNDYYNNILETSDIDYIIAGDTDSCAKDSIISTNIFGDIEIQDVFTKLSASNKVICDINNREFIFPNNLTLPYYDENEKTIKNGIVQYIEKHKVKKRMFKIKTSNDKYVKITEDHSVMVLGDDNKLVEKKPTELIRGDKIITI